MFKVGDIVSSHVKNFYMGVVISCSSHSEHIVVQLSDGDWMTTVERKDCYLELPIVEIIEE